MPFNSITFKQGANIIPAYVDACPVLGTVPDEDLVVESDRVGSE
jgi:hypothetical protein